MSDSPRAGDMPPASPMSAAAASVGAGADAGGDKTFSDVLWDQVERVYLRLTNGRHDLKRLKTYMEARADMARVWSKSLSKASAQPELEDSSSIGALWHEIKETGLAQAKGQEAFAAVCIEIAAALEAQIVEVKKQKTLLHERWTRLLADVKKKQQAHDKAHKEYLESVKQAETAIMNRDAAHEQKMPDKAVVKAETRAKQAQKEVDNLHTAYQKSVQQLQEAQASQDSTCADLLTQFERLERARLRVFLDQLDRWASQHDTLKAQLDSVAASLHTHANAVNIDADVQEFIRTHNTGKVPPPHVEYIRCQSQILDHANGGGVSMGSDRMVSGNLAAPNTAFVPPSPQAAMGGQPQVSPAAAPPQAPMFGGVAAAAVASSPMAPPMGMGMAAPVEAAPSAVFAPPVVGGGGGTTAVALYDFDQNEPDDLGFKAGQTIRLITSADADDWWQGELNGKVGIFPKAYVAKQGEGAAGGAPAPAPMDGGVEGAAMASAPLASPPPPAAAPAAVEAAPAQVAPAEQAAAGGAPAGAEVPKLLDAQCAALFDFDGQDEDELTFKAGQNLIITGELNGWFLGRVEGSEKVGIFPSNFVQMSS